MRSYKPQNYRLLMIFILHHLCEASVHICTTPNSDLCPTQINCAEDEPCIIRCAENFACRGKTVFCPANHRCEVHCVNPKAQKQCEEMTINAQTSSYLLVNASLRNASVFGNDDANTMDNSIIHCPLSHICRINCDGDDLLRGTQIYAVQGFNSVQITATNYVRKWCYRKGRMFCKYDFSSNCPITTDANLPFRCSRLSQDFTCDDYTLNPTISTMDPTTNPTITPSAAPVIHPTLIPSIHPTINPTIAPTTNPSMNPALTPTIDPSSTPTAVPSMTSTANPSIKPTSAPSITPTANPSFNPTINPSFNPTINPSFNPTINPSFNPTINPSFTPTTNPSFNPTINPIVSPTVSPTIAPTNMYTNTPSNNPTNIITTAATAESSTSTIYSSSSLATTHLTTDTTHPTSLPQSTLLSSTRAPSITPTEDSVYITTTNTSRESTNGTRVTESTLTATELTAYEEYIHIIIDKRPLSSRIIIAIIIVGGAVCCAVSLYSMYIAKKSKDEENATRLEEKCRSKHDKNMDYHSTDDHCDGYDDDEYHTLHVPMFNTKKSEKKALKRMNTTDKLYAQQIIKQQESVEMKEMEKYRNQKQKEATIDQRFKENLSNFASQQDQDEAEILKSMANDYVLSDDEIASDSDSKRFIKNSKKSSKSWIETGVELIRSKSRSVSRSKRHKFVKLESNSDELSPIKNDST